MFRDPAFTRTALLLVFLVLGTNAQAQNQKPSLPPLTGDFSVCQAQFPPAGPPLVNEELRRTAKPLCFSEFAILYSPDKKSALYAAAALDAERLARAAQTKREGSFFADPRLAREERAELADYARSGYDRGHLGPAGDMSTPVAKRESFSLSNMIPQAPTNNRQVWNQVEQTTRKDARAAAGTVYVFTGPVYGQGRCPIALEIEAGTRPPQTYDLETCTIGNRLPVPTHVFKLVYDQAANRAWAYWAQNLNSVREAETISYQELVRRTGIEFLPGFPTEPAPTIEPNALPPTPSRRSDRQQRRRSHIYRPGHGLAAHRALSHDGAGPAASARARRA